MRGLRAAEQRLGMEARAVGEVREEIGLERREMIGGHRHVGLAPPDRVRGLGILDDELVLRAAPRVPAGRDDERAVLGEPAFIVAHRILDQGRRALVFGRSEEHTSELQSLMRISYAVFCLKKKTKTKTTTYDRASLTVHHIRKNTLT